VIDWDLRDSGWVAEKLLLDRNTVETLMASHLLPGFAIGDRWLVSESKLREFLEKEEQRQFEADELSRSTTTAPEVPPRGRRRKSGVLNYRLFGQTVEGASYRAMLTDVLKQLAKTDREFLQRFSDEGGRTRKFVSKNAADLYRGRPDLAEEFKESIGDGWWVGTNYSAREIVAIVQRACQVAGIAWGIDLLVSEPEDEERIARALSIVGMARGLDPSASLRHDELFVEAALDE
jgi:hypothetical protein